MRIFLLLFFVSLLTLITSCEKSQVNEYIESNKILPNSLPLTGIKAKYSEDNGFVNFSEMKKDLNIKQQTIFSKSVSWYATEAEFSLTKINNMTAKEIVSTVNCLKKNRGKPLGIQSKCFD